MDRWMDGRMGGWTDGQMDGWADGRMDGRTGHRERETATEQHKAWCWALAPFRGPALNTRKDSRPIKRKADKDSHEQWSNESELRLELELLR